MKLLQWVHRKLRQNSTDPFKDFTLGNPCTCLTVQPTLDNQYSQAKASFSSSFFDNNREDDELKEETAAVISELFEGFLTIGTLGAETITNEPATPTFAMPLENINAEVTDNDLRLISYELEKFLVAEKEEILNESSGRNSHVNSITLSGKQMDGSEAEDYGNKSLCPLQGYLLGSSIELPETTEVKKERASLAELFNRTKTSPDCTETGEMGDTQVKHTHNSAMQIMRKMLKKVHGSSKSHNTSGDDAVSASTNKKLQKVLRMFHRKVHPEINTMNAKDFVKPHKGTINGILDDCCRDYDNGDPAKPAKSLRSHSTTKSRKWSQNCKTNCKPLQHGVSCSGLTAPNEHWIKTDADYLVLEL